MFIQYSYYYSVSHPALHVLNNYFAAFNEEKGEKSIHLALMHLVDSNFSFENLREHYLLQPAFRKLFKECPLKNFKKTGSGYKNATLSTGQSPSPTFLDKRLEKIYFKAIRVIEDVSENRHFCFDFNSKSSVIYSDSPISQYEDQLMLGFTEKISSIKNPILKNFQELRQKITEEIDAVVDDGDIYW